MKKIRLLTLLWVVLVASTLAGCGDNKNTTNADSNNSGDLIIEDTTWQYDAVIDYNDSLVEIAEQCIKAQDAILTKDVFPLTKLKILIQQLITQSLNAKIL